MIIVNTDGAVIAISLSEARMCRYGRNRNKHGVYKDRHNSVRKDKYMSYFYKRR